MKLPFTFSLALIYRILFPGFLLALGFFPILQTVLDPEKVHIPFEVSFTLTVILSGWLIVVLDMNIYMAYEGRRYWPRLLRKWFLNREKKRLEKLKSASKNSDYEKSLEAWVEIRLFPLDENGEYTVRYPTRLGNLCTAYEDYPSRIYGMDCVFYWPRIWLTLDKDLREEISNQQALADSTVYSSAALFSCGVLCIIYMLLNIIFPCIIHLPSSFYLLSYAFLSFITGYGIYRYSLYTHAQFGDIFKAIFDLHQKDKLLFPGVVKMISDIIDDKISSKDKYGYIWRYLQYNRIKMPGGDIFTPEQILSKKKEANNSEEL